MFDWEGEELANIIWGEAGENEDHRVPYPDENYEKSPGPYGEHSKVSDHKAAHVKLAEKTPDRINTQYDTHGMVSRDGFCSAPVLSSSDATRLDLQHTDEKAQVDNGSQSFDTQPEDREASSFIDFGWANAGSFDDLDGILSNNEYENEDILSIDSPSLRLGDLRSDCEHVETKLGFIKDVNTNLEKMECSGGKNEKSASSNIARRTRPVIYPVGAVNVARPRETGIGIKIGKMGTKDQKSDPLFSLGNQGKEFERRYTQHIRISSSKARNHETESSPYKQFISPLLSPCDYNISGNKQPSGSSSLIPLSMTPQEKIEKLRRRQQMRALLAIRKQQQEFRHRPSCNDYSNESQSDESLSTLMSLEKSNLDTRHMMMHRSSLEDTILHQLENVISTLGIQIRVCIRDSLFRLAQSALQRQYAEDTVSTSEPNAVAKESLGSTKSSARRTQVGETKTNPIDRAVAHLLFHRPAGLSGELLQLLESPSSGSRVDTEGSSRGMALF